MQAEPYWRDMTAEERFWTRVQKSDGCWLWTGKVDKNGYGRLRQDKQPGEVRGKFVRAPRFSLELHGVHIPPGMQALHHCDNPPCVRPDHLYVGTPADNVRDARVRERYLQSHCKYGHELTVANTSINKTDGRRRCRICINDRERERRKMRNENLKRVV